MTDPVKPVLETPAQAPGLSRPVRALFGWLGFRYLRLRTFREAVPVVIEATEEVASGEAVPA